MRDIGRRIQRYRLSRYARSEGGIRVPRWAWIALGGWLLWAGLASDHSFFQLWRLHRTYTHEQDQLRRTQTELAKLEASAKDPNERRRDAERRLREDEGYARPNEIIFRIDDPDSAHAAQ